MAFRLPVDSVDSFVGAAFRPQYAAPIRHVVTPLTPSGKPYGLNPPTGKERPRVTPGAFLSPLSVGGSLASHRSTTANGLCIFRDGDVAAAD